LFLEKQISSTSVPPRRDGVVVFSRDVYNAGRLNNLSKTKMSKKLIKKTKIILAVVAALPAAVFAQTPTPTPTPTGGGGWNVGNYSSSGLPSSSIYTIIVGIMKWLLAIFGFVAIIGFVISGIMYLVAAGNDDMQEKAKNQMMWSIVGVIVGLVGLVVIYAVDNMLDAVTF
jgi:hypothetical protein